MKIDKYIEIVRSTTPSLSYMGSESCSAIYAVLRKHYLKVSVTIINDVNDLEALVERQPDLVFLGMEFVPRNTALGLADPDKIWLSSYFDQHCIAYTGSGQAAHESERDKHLAKKLILEAGLNTAAFHVVKRDQTVLESDINLNYPLFIKPLNRGGGLGINSDSVIHNFNQLRDRANYITNTLNSDSLVEEYLPGREFSVAILKNSYSNKYLVMPIELVAPIDNNGARLLSSQVKSANVEEAREVTDRNIRSKVVTLALDSFHALGARDYGRIDIRMDGSGIPHFLEANLIPSLIDGYGSFPKACMLNVGLGYEDMIKAITELGLDRNLNDSEESLNPLIAVPTAISI